MFSSTVNEILPFIPQEIHTKTIEVFNRIPGTLLKYFEPKSISKKAECGKCIISENTHVLVLIIILIIV